jgi:flagellar biosynthesis protein FlhF
MQIKVFEAEDIASALKKVKESLGPDALIISSRTVRRKGKAGLWGKKYHEVTAAVDSRRDIQEDSDSVQLSQSVQSAAQYAYQENSDSVQLSQPVQSTAQYADQVEERSTQESLQQEKNSEQNSLDVIRNEIEALKELVQKAVIDTSSLGKFVNLASRASFAYMSGPNGSNQGNLFQVNHGDETDWFAPMVSELSRRGIDEQALSKIIRLALQKYPQPDSQSNFMLQDFCKEVIADIIQVSGPIADGFSTQKRVALVGPTGVGKTTTIAKLAADYMVNSDKKMALVTIDTYRVAAVEQLKVYGEIMDLPVEVVMQPEQLREVFDRHRDKDLILIDTAGRSPKDDMSLQELGSFLGPESGTENHLVLAATTRDEELRESVSKFGGLNLKSLIFTKLDECESLASLINVGGMAGKPLSYLTNGQRVPEDLFLADPGNVAELIMREPQNTFH